MWNTGRQFFSRSSNGNSIKSLNLSNNANLSDEYLRKIVVSCPELEVLKLSCCREITSKAVGFIMRSCPNRTHLWINRCSRVTNLSLKGCSIHRKLEWLVASESPLDDNALIDTVRECPDLMVVHLRRCTRLTFWDGVSEVAYRCNKLKEINRKFSTQTIVPWMIVRRPFLRKIISTHKVTTSHKNKSIM